MTDASAPWRPTDCFGCNHPDAWKAKKELWDTVQVEDPRRKGLAEMPLNCCRRTANPWQPPPLKDGEVPY
jgi:hypothetical protein